MESEADSEDDEAVVGCVGSLILATRGAAGAGEVVVKIRGGREAYLAWSQDPLPSGTTVLVIERRSARTVTVVAWTDELRVDALL